MKELNIEEKAKAYDETIERADKLRYVSDKDSLQCKTVEHIFPELKKFENDEIRKWLIGYFNQYIIDGMPLIFGNGLNVIDVIAWLEKQGEQKPEGKTALEAAKEEKVDNQNCVKPADTVEPKFKVGDWVVWDNKISCHIDNIYQGKESLMYTITDVHNMTRSYSVKGFDNNARLWTIQDAKDGDVLCCESGWTCIFKAFNSDISFSSYCFMDSTGWFCETGSESHTLEKAFIKAYNGNIYPATKEQRDLLFQKMKEVGYEWDAEKKELKKIEQKHKSNIVPIFKEGDIIKNKKNGDTVKVEQILSDSYCYSGWDGAATIHSDFLISEQDDWELVEQKPAENSSKNSEESDVVVEESSEYKNGFECGKQYVLKYPEEFNLCKKLAAWSEEDEIMFRKAIITIDNVRMNTDSSEYYQGICNWLISLKDRVGYESDCTTKQEWKQENIEELSDFENVMMHIGDSFFGPHAGLDPNDTNTIKEQANLLLGLVPKQEWSEEDERNLQGIIDEIEANKNKAPGYDLATYDRFISWLKSLRPQNRWKPSAFHLECIEDAISLYETRSINAIGLKEILDELKKLKG